MTNDTFTLDLPDDERRLLAIGLDSWDADSKGRMLMAPIVGATIDDFHPLVRRLHTAVATGAPLSALEWTRVLVLAEVAYASEILGAASSIAKAIGDRRALDALRDVQWSTQIDSRSRLIRESMSSRSGAMVPPSPVDTADRHLDVTEEERDVLLTCLSGWGGHAMVAPMVGVPPDTPLHRYAVRLYDVVNDDEPISELDLIRAVLLTELCWGSAVLGAGIDFPVIGNDEKALPAIRSLQRKIVTDERIELLIDNALV